LGNNPYTKSAFEHTHTLDDLSTYLNSRFQQNTLDFYRSVLVRVHTFLKKSNVQYVTKSKYTEQKTKLQCGVTCHKYCKMNH